MTHSYISGGTLGQRLRQLGLTALLAGSTALAAQAQTLNYGTAGVTNVAGTYTDISATGNAIPTGGITDDANSVAQNIGFTFTYNGASFTQFVFNTNGIIRLGGVAPSTAALYYDNNSASTAIDPLGSTNAADVNLIMPFNFDLIAGSNAAGVNYRVLTSGTAGSRVCTIQWGNVADKPGAGSDAVNVTQFANFSFQLKLYETTNNIEFVYGAATAGAGAAGARFPNVGLKGSGNATGQIEVAVKTATGAWSTTTFQNTPYGTAAHTITKTVGPDVGRTYRFTPAAANDGAVSAIYTLGKLPTIGLPHAVQAVITNTGSAPLTSLVATLNVTGANTITSTQTIASLAAGASTTVTFATLPATLVAGVNTVTVSIPADANTANNSVATQQTVNTVGTFSYVPTDRTNVAFSSLGASNPANGLAFGVKYTTVAASSVNSVSAYLQDVNTVGKTVYGAVFSTTGTVLAQSANYTVLAGDIGTYKTFTMTTPYAVAANGSFLAVLVQAPSSTTTSFFPIGYQNEAPLRPATFYISAAAGGTLTDVSTLNGGTYRFMIEANLAGKLATSKELQRAITIYPNPSATGVFNLDIHNANAKNLLGVEVVNQLGQRVYTGSAHDNLTNTVDLSNLAGGLYHLQVRNGEEFSSQQISIVK